MLKAVLFDWDGTICNSLPQIEEAFRKTQKELKLDFTYEQYRQLIGIPTETQAQIIIPDNPQLFTEHYRGHCAAHGIAPAYEGAAEALAEIKNMGLLIGLVTSKTRNAAAAAAKELGVFDYFDTMLCGDEAEHPKPDPEPCRRALEKLGLKPCEAVYAGDSFQDMSSAQGAGMKAIAVTWGARTREELISCQPDFLADTMQELVNIIRLLKK